MSLTRVPATTKSSGAAPTQSSASAMSQGGGSHDALRAASFSEGERLLRPPDGDSTPVQQKSNGGGVLGGAWAAIKSLPGDLIRGTGHVLDYANPFDDESVADHLAEDSRTVKFIIRLIADASQNLDLLSKALVEVYFKDNMPVALRQRVQEVANRTGATVGGYLVGRVVGTQLIKLVATRILASQAISQLLAKAGASAAAASTGVGAAISVALGASVLEKMQSGSERLASSHPTVFTQLRPHDLDLLWTFVEPQLPALQLDFDRAVQDALSRTSAQDETPTDAPTPGPVDQGPGAAPKVESTYVIRAGDTLSALAKRLWGDASRYVEIARANGITNPSLIRVGQELSIPSGSSSIPREQGAVVSVGAPEKQGTAAGSQSEHAAPKATEPSSGQSSAALPTSSRGGFLYRLMPSEDRKILTSPSSVVSKAQALGWIAAKGDDGRPFDSILRAEAAQIIATIEGWRAAPTADQVAWFSDVMNTDWYFGAAHQARVHGVFMGTAENLFMGARQLSDGDAGLVLARYRPGSNPILKRDAQIAHLNEGVRPPAGPLDVGGLLDKERLSAPEIAKVRAYAATLPAEAATDIYRRIASKVMFRNQRDNEGIYGRDRATWKGATHGDAMCNVTSIAMALNQVGVGADETSKQFEDTMDEKREHEKMGSREERDPQLKLISSYGAKGERLSAPGFRSGEQAQEWFAKQVRPRFEKGAAASMGIKWGAARYPHIVRLQWVEDDGLLVDDPYGRLYAAGGGAYYTYEANDPKVQRGAGAVGEDNKWSWAQVAWLMSPGDRYVQFVTA